MEPTIKVLCLTVLLLSLFVCNMEARETRLFVDQSDVDNPAGESNTAGFGEDNTYGAGTGNAYDSYRGQRNGNGNVYGNTEVFRPGSGAGSNAAFGQGGDKFESGYGGRSESNGAYRSGYGGGYGNEAGSGFGNAEFNADNGYSKQTP